MIHATEILESPVYDVGGNYVGKVRELCIDPGEQANRISRVVIGRGRYQPLLVRHEQVADVTASSVRLNVPELALEPYAPNEAWLTVRKDLLDQQIIDINGRKVVRVNDLDLLEQRVDNRMELLVTQVDVGVRGAVRRLLQGIVSPAFIRRLQAQLPMRAIPWDFVDLIETDPMRRVKLKISHAKLAQLHPADIADIIEELAPAGREAVIEALDDETAAEALSELDPRLQVRIIEEMDKEKAADIIEEMDPDRAADVLAELPAETSTELLEEMPREEREDVQELLRFEPYTAGGLMTTEFLVVPESATVTEAMERIRASEFEIESLDAIFLVGEGERLAGTVALARLLLAAGETPLVRLRQEPMVSLPVEAKEKEVFELFDKYNLRALAVVADGERLVGAITADDIISRLLHK